MALSGSATDGFCRPVCTGTVRQCRSVPVNMVRQWPWSYKDCDFDKNGAKFEKLKVYSYVFDDCRDI